MNERADLHFHVVGASLEEIAKIAKITADPFYGYTETLKNPDHEEWEAKRKVWVERDDDEEYFDLPEPERTVVNPVARPYKMTIEAHVDGDVEQYAYVRKFRATVRCYVPFEDYN